MMIAPSTALGRYATGPVRSTSTSATAPAATSPATWVRAPMSSFTAVRELLAPIGNACDTPAAIVAAAMARSS